MKKVALIMKEKIHIKQPGTLWEKIIYRTKGYLNTFRDNQVDSILLEEEDMEVMVVKIPEILDGDWVARIGKLFDWVSKEGIGIISFDEYIFDENRELIERGARHINVDIAYGDNILIPLYIKTMNKLVKSKGVDLNERDLAILGDQNPRQEIGLIKYLSPEVKFLTYIPHKSVKTKRMVDEIFDNSGFSIRVCDDLNECIGDLGVLINLSKDEVLPKKITVKDKLVVLNLFTYAELFQKNITVLNEVKVDITAKFPKLSELSNINKYKLCEMYMLTKLGKHELLKQPVEGSDIEDLYETFKASNFKITGYEGINL